MSGSIIAKVPYVSVCRFRHNCFDEVTFHIFRSLRYAIKVYSVVHSLQTLVYKRSAIKNDFLNTLLTLIKKILKSVGFFSFYTFGVKFSLCFCNWLTDGKFNFLSMVFMTLFSGLSSVFENSSRIVDYSIFTYPRSLEGVWDLFVKLNWVKPIPFGRQLLFAVAIGLGLVIYKNKKEEMPKSYQNITNLVFGKNLFN